LSSGFRLPVEAGGARPPHAPPCAKRVYTTHAASSVFYNSELLNLLRGLLKKALDIARIEYA
jgi:hypothetical protein